MRIVVAAIAVAMIGLAARAEHWPGWRGPRGDGTSHESHLPLHWSATENIRWKAEVSGTGHSSPVVWGDRIFLTSSREPERQRLLLCYDRRDGQRLWERVVLTAPLERKHARNSYASSTPATDGRHVWVSFLAQPRMVVACYDLDGGKVWETSPGEFHSVHGFCSPPILYKDMVILNGDQDDPGAFLVALDKATGAERWRAPRPGVRSYTPPFITEAAGRMQLVLTGSNCVTSYDPDTGRRLWVVDGPTEQYVASMVYHDGLFFLTAGYPEYHFLAIRPDGSGNVTDKHVAWRTQKGAGYVPSPVAWDHHVYVVKDDGLASCFEAKTGTRRWAERLGKSHNASPVAADGYLYFPDEEGTTYVLKAGPTFDVVARNPLGEKCFASPAVSGGNIFIRTSQHLWCIGK